jgi:PAS domain S-box-containing protein
MSLDRGTGPALTKSPRWPFRRDRFGARWDNVVLAAVLVLFLSVFAVRLLSEEPDNGTAFLYALPITLVAVQYGAKGGILSAGVGLALYGLYTQINPVEITFASFVTRAVVFFLLGGLLGRFSDRLHAAHQIVKSSQAQLQAILTNTTAVIYTKDVEGAYILVNHQFEKLFKVTEEEVAGKTDFDLFPKYAADAFRATDRKVLKERTALEIEEIIPHKDGPHTYISIKFPMLDPDGEPYGICGISTDITARIQAEQLLKERKEQIRQILETASEAFVSIDSDSIITGWNKQAEATFGWSQSQAVGRGLVDLIMPERFRAKHLAGMQRFLATGEGPVLNKRMELVAVHRDGHEFPIEIVISALRTKDGYVFNAFLHDITERRRAEELARIKADLERQAAELRRSNRELAQFAHVASHDLAEPLRTVSSFVQLLDYRYRGKLDEDADEFIGYAVEGASRMQALINALSAYSTFGSAEHTPQPVECFKVAEQALGGLRAMIDESGATVRIDPLPTVMADATQLSVVFQNLISNGIKFTKTGTPKLHISAERILDGWSFSVTDNGIGIKREHQQRIFEMFRRLHTHENYEGTGIGLTICRKIIARHGGEIWVEAAPDGGSTFRFTIPDHQPGTVDGNEPGDTSETQSDAPAASDDGPPRNGAPAGID